MKLFKTLAAGLLASMLAYTASAQTTIRIIGAQVFRAPVHNAIENILQAGYTVGQSGTGISTSLQAVFTGTTQAIYGGYPVVIKTTFGTSTSAVRAVATGTAVTTFLSGSYTGINLTDLVSSTGADVCLSGEFQATTIFPTPALSDTIVGVAPYVWVKNAGAPSTLTNITACAARSLFTQGYFWMNQLSGIDTDDTTPVLLIGRDEGASSRECLLDEIGLGAQQDVINQYQLKIQGTAGPTGTVLSGSLYPAATTDGIPYPIGHSGYTTFSSEDAALATPGSFAAFGGYAVGYSGVTDAATAGLTTLSWNGVSYTPDAVTNGSYTYWSYCHWMYQPSYAGIGQIVANQIGGQICSTTAAATFGISISSMTIHRTADGGTIIDGNPYYIAPPPTSNRVEEPVVAQPVATKKPTVKKSAVKPASKLDFTF